MSQTERADYDDELFGPKRIRDPKLRDRAGYLWLVTWVWFLIGSTMFLACEFRRNANTILLLMIGNTILACLFITGTNLVQRGYSNFLPAISLGSVLAAMFFGWWGILIGFSLLGQSVLDRPYWDRVIGAVLLVFTFGFIVLNLVSLTYTLKYALQMVQVPPISDAHKKRSEHVSK